MTTLAELVAATPAYTRGAAVQALGGAGTWRIVYELADPSAGVSVVWYDITDYVAGHRYERGADQPNGEYAASVATVDLIVDDDSLAPWAEDTSAVFGTHVTLGAGLLIRCGLIRVVGTTVEEWVPRFTLRVESWSDASYAIGQIRRHTVVARDLLTGLVNVPVSSTVAESWIARITRVVETEAGWDFGLTVYGADQVAGPANALTMADRDESSNAIAELDATCGPAGVVWRTTRKGDMIVHPGPWDTWHAGLFTGGATGTEYTWPATIGFSYLADDDPAVVAYAVDDNVADPFGFDKSEIGIVNRLIVTDDGVSPYDIDNATSIARYGYRPRSVTWQVANDSVADDLLAYLDTAEIQARPMTTTVDLPGFMRAAALDHLSPISIQHTTAAGRSTVEADGYVRSITEQISPSPGRVNWTLTIVADITSTDEVAELNPVTSLAVSSYGSDFVTIGWTNPSQTITPTGTQVRIPSISSIWLTLDYPITAFTWLFLDPSTTYELEVRLIRQVDGIITNVSPVRSVTQTTSALTYPDPDDGGGGDIDVDFPDPDTGCTLEWKLDRSAVAGSWATVDTGTISTAPWEVTIDSSSFAAGYLYRVCVREVCSGVPGAYTCSRTFINGCTTDASLATAPYDDASLVMFVPEVCPPDRIIEAVSGIEGFRGPAFGELVGTDTDVQIVCGDDGIAAYGPASGLDGLTGDRTMSARVTLGTQATVRVFQAGSMFLGSVLSGAGWKPRLVVFTRDAGQISIQGSTELALDTEYHIGGTYDESTGTATLYVDGVATGTPTGSTPGPLAAALPVWTVGGPDDSTITDAAVWSSVLATLPGLVPFSPDDIADLTHWFDATVPTSITASSGLVSNWQNLKGTADATQSTTASKPVTGTRTINSLNAIDFDGSDDFLEFTGNWWTGMTDTTIFAAVEVDSGSSGFIVSGSITSQSNVQFGLQHRSASGQLAFVNRNSSGTYLVLIENTDIRDGNPHTAGGVFDASTLAELFVDGTSDGTDATPGTLPSFNRSNIGAIHSGTPTAGHLSCAIGEILIYARALSGTEVTQVSDYLAAKWGA